MDAVKDMLMAVPHILPQPLSPLFQKGGSFEWINEDVGLTCFFIFIMFLVDVLIVKPFLKPKSRYFALHIVANTLSCIFSWPDVKRALLDDPLHAFSGPSCSMFANSAVASIHLYHIIAFPLRGEDIFHHLTFVVVLCGLAIPFKQTGGAANNLGCFFLSGLPGGLDYVSLVLEKQGAITRTAQKKFCAFINVWLRGPSMSVYLFIGLQALWRGSFTTPMWTIIVVVFLHFTNGQYYARQAVESLAVYLEREKNGLSEPSSPASPAVDDGSSKKQSSGKQPSRVGSPKKTK